MLIFAIWLTLIRTVVLQRSWYQMSGCSVQWEMNKNTHGYMTVCQVHQGYLSKFCELFCGHSSSSQECVTVWHSPGTVWLLFYYWTSKLINVLLSPSFPNYKGPDPRYKWVEKSLTCNKHVGFKALVISKSFSSLLIGCVRRPTPRTDKGSSSITDNMITFNGISVYNILNFKFKRYSL